MMDETWVERMLLVIEKSPRQVAGGFFGQGALVTSKTSGRRAVVASSNESWTFLRFRDDGGEWPYPTSQVNSNYRLV
jgi:hypothetical protein